MLESDLFKYRLPSNTIYFRYIDDILIFLPQNIEIEEIVEKLNVEPSINFTDERKSNNTKPFQGILLIKSQNSLTLTLPKTHKQKQLHTFLLPPQQNRNGPNKKLLPKSTQNM